MSPAKKDDTVKVHYMCKLDDGTVLGSLAKGEPLQFTIGEGKVIRGFEQAVVGMTPGESKSEKIPSEQAFGPYRKARVLQIDREQIPAHTKLEVGKWFEFKQPDGRKTRVVLTDISESKLTFDANHPLAGRDLIFDIQLVEII